MRNFSQNFSAKIKARAIIKKDCNTLYKCKDFEKLEQDLKNLKGTVFVDKNSINAYDYALIKDSAKILTTNP